MRKKGLLAIFVLLVLVLALFYFFTDKWLERQIESVATSLVGAKVEIDNLDVKLFKMQIGFQHLQVTDPQDTWHNLIETGRTEFNLAVEPLFFKRVVIEDLRLENLRSGTQRTTDGKIPVKPKPKSTEPTVFDQAAKSLQAELTKNVGFDFSKLNRKVNVDSIIKLLDLHSPAKLDSFRQDIQKTTTQWQGEINSLTTLESNAKQMFTQAQTIQVDQLKSLEDISRAISTVKSLRSQVDSLQRIVQAKKNSFQSDWTRLETQTKSVDDWIKSDIQRVADKAQLPDISVQNAAQILFGPAVVHRVQTGLRYLNTAHYYSQKLSSPTKVESPPRFKGQYISFPDYRHWPQFWLKQAVISGETGSSPEARGIILAGSAQNISTNQKLVGKPAIIQLSGEQINRTAYQLKAVLDNAGASAREDFNFAVSRISLNNANLGGSGVLPQSFAQGSMDVKFALGVASNALDGQLDVLASNLAFRFEDQAGKDRFSQIVRDLLQSVNQITVHLRFSGPADQLKVKMDSNLDELLAARFKTLVSDEVAKARAEIEKRIRSEVETRKQQALALYQQKRHELEKRLNELEGLVNEKVAFAETKKKELEKKFEDEKKKQTEGLKKKAIDLFQKPKPSE